MTEAARTSAAPQVMPGVTLPEVMPAGAAPVPEWSPTMSEAEADAWLEGSDYTADVWHGTSEEIGNAIKGEGFRPSERGFYGRGVYLADAEGEASTYTFAFDKPAVLRAKVRLENPWRGTTADLEELVRTAGFDPADMAMAENAQVIPNLVEAAGHDGLVVEVDRGQRYISALRREQVVVISE